MVRAQRSTDGMTSAGRFGSDLQTCSLVSVGNEANTLRVVQV